DRDAGALDKAEGERRVGDRDPHRARRRASRRIEAPAGAAAAAARAEERGEGCEGNGEGRRGAHGGISKRLDALNSVEGARERANRNPPKGRRTRLDRRLP